MAITVSVLMACDALLNATHAGNQKDVIKELLKFLVSSLGVTKKDLAQLSPRLVTQLDALIPLDGPKPKQTGSNKSEKSNAAGSDGAISGPKEPKARKSDKKEQEPKEPKPRKRKDSTGAAPKEKKSRK